MIRVPGVKALNLCGENRLIRVRCQLHLPHVREKSCNLSLWLIDTLILLNSSFVGHRSGPLIQRFSPSRDILYINVSLLGVGVVHLAQERKL